MCHETQTCYERINDVILNNDVTLRMAQAIRGDRTEYSGGHAVNRARHAAYTTCIPIHCMDSFHRRKVASAGFAAAQDDKFVLLRESSHAFAYFHDTYTAW